MKRVVIALLVGSLLLAGCGREETFKADSVDLVDLVRILPTQEEFVPAAGHAAFSNDAREADLDAVVAALAPDADSAKARQQYKDLGFRSGAIRTWEGPDDAAMTVVLSRWDTHMTAVNVGSGVSEVVPISNGARPWTPDQLRGARGAATTDPDPGYTLSFAIENVSVFVRTSGPVSERTVIRTMELLSKPLITARDS